VPKLKSSCLMLEQRKIECLLLPLVQILHICDNDRKYHTIVWNKSFSVSRSFAFSSSMSVWTSTFEHNTASTHTGTNDRASSISAWVHEGDIAVGLC
jgi:hypothetical protein